MGFVKLLLALAFLCSACSGQVIWRDGKWNRSTTRTREVIDMAQPSWISPIGGSKDFDIAANWNTGIAPLTGDTVTFDENGQANCTIGMDQSALALKVVRKSGYLGTIGGPDVPLQFAGSSALVSTFTLGPGAGDTHIDPTITGFCSIKGDIGSTVFFYGNSGTVFANGGHIVYTAGCTMPSLHNSGAVMEILDGTGTPPVFIANESGRMIIRRTLATTVEVQICGGVVYYAGGDPAVAGKWRHYGGTLILEPSAILAGASGINYRGYGGTLNFSNSRYAVTFTADSIFSYNLEVLENADFSFAGVDLRKEYP